LDRTCGAGFGASLSFRPAAVRYVPGGAPVPIVAAMVGVAFWWVETPTVWPWPYLRVLLVVGAVLAGCWWVLARRDGLQLARLTAPDMGAVLLWFGVAGVASSVLAVVFDSGVQSPFTPADSPSFAVVQTVVVSVATAVVEDATAAAVVLAAAALIALRRPWTGWAPWVAIGVGAASRGRTANERPAIAKGLALVGSGIPYAVTHPGARVVGTLITITPSLYGEVLADLEGYHAHRPATSHYIRTTSSVIDTIHWLDTTSTETLLAARPTGNVTDGVAANRVGRSALTSEKMTYGCDLGFWWKLRHLPSKPVGHTRHTSHTGHTATNPQVTAPHQRPFRGPVPGPCSDCGRSGVVPHVKMPAKADRCLT